MPQCGEGSVDDEKERLAVWEEDDASKKMDPDSSSVLHR